MSPPADADSRSYPHAVSFSFDYDTERRARLVTAAVAVETDEIDDDRSTATVARDGPTLRVNVFARDLVAMRAGANTWLRLVATAEDVCALTA